MKLLLTSAGITNKSIENTLLELIDKLFSECSLAFIPTAANVEEGDKSWMITDLNNCKNLGFSMIDIVDISALPNKIWKKRLENVDVLLFSGGNTFHLMYWLEKTGLKNEMAQLLKNKVYVGISAGSIVASKHLSLAEQEDKIYTDSAGEILTDEHGLGLVDFHIRPHLNSPYFPQTRVEILKERAKEVAEPIYALDDNSAIQVVDDIVAVISEGTWKKFN